MLPEARQTFDTEKHVHVLLFFKGTSVSVVGVSEAVKRTQDRCTIELTVLVLMWKNLARVALPLPRRSTLTCMPAL